jgi:hypothetical protein
MSLHPYSTSRAECSEIGAGRLQADAGGERFRRPAAAAGAPFAPSRPLRRTRRRAGTLQRPLARRRVLGRGCARPAHRRGSTARNKPVRFREGVPEEIAGAVN